MIGWRASASTRFNSEPIRCGGTKADAKPAISVRYSYCSEWRHTAHEQPAEARIAYRYHPRFGEVVQIRRRLARGGVEFVVVL